MEVSCAGKARAQGGAASRSEGNSVKAWAPEEPPAEARASEEQPAEARAPEEPLIKVCIKRSRLQKPVHRKSRRQRREPLQETCTPEEPSPETQMCAPEEQPPRTSAPEEPPPETCAPEEPPTMARTSGENDDLADRLPGIGRPLEEAIDVKCSPRGPSRMRCTSEDPPVESRSPEELLAERESLPEEVFPAQLPRTSTQRIVMGRHDRMFPMWSVLAIEVFGLDGAIVLLDVLRVFWLVGEKEIKGFIAYAKNVDEMNRESGSIAAFAKRLGCAALSLNKCSKSWMLEFFERIPRAFSGKQSDPKRKFDWSCKLQGITKEIGI
ncbi:neurofilament heavy polypeptide-like [Penaeus japonicus]|uniref:neurofilament heavy polypeptide-like n=1 Tax=Penaeus japonicus TaxID=27405 RepID=UPI001C71454E|nr:neurofilament heavy polypeptide-like [Penaeus japonicus]